MKKPFLVIFAVVVVIGLVGAGTFWGPRLWPGKSDANENEAPHAKSLTTVVLSPEKYAAVKIHSVPATHRDVQQACVVPGKLAYRRIRRVELKAPVDAVVQEVKVKPGDAIERGTQLALMTSPEVGLARAEVEKSKSDLKIANRVQEWDDAIARNLNDLIEYLRKKPPSQEIEDKFNERLLGDHRKSVLTAYSTFMLAQKLWDSAERAVKKGSISEQKARQLEADRDIAWVSFLAVCEQSEYEAGQARERAAQSRTYARRLVDVNQQKLDTMLGEFSKTDDDQSSAETAELTWFSMVAPFAGTVEQRLASNSQRVEAGTLLFVVANTDVLEVNAEVREGDWQKVAPYLRDGEGKKLAVSVTALGEDRSFEATIDYVGRFIDENKAVPLVALVENSGRELVPGMFARISIPAGTSQNALVIPPGALLTNDRRDFVFVQDEQHERTFHRVDVQVGRRTPEWITISRGLAAGQKVVVEGAVVLMNELLLPLEEEE